MAARAPIRVAIDAHVVGRQQTGNETYIVNLAEALAARSDVEVRTFVDRGMPWPGDAPPPVEALQWRSRYMRVPLELPTRARRMGADLLHVQYVAPPVRRLPVVAPIHDISFEELDGAFPRTTEWRLKATVRWTAHHAAAVVASSAYTRMRIIDRYRLAPERVHVALLGVHARWRPMPDDESLPDRAALPRLAALPTTFVLAVGNLHPRKNLARLTLAVDRARRSGAGDLQLVIVGKRLWKAAELDAAIRKVDAQAWTHLPGYVTDDELRRLYGRATVVAYPSLYEGFGLPVLEAMACGAPVVASNTTSIPEVAGDAALLVEPLDVDAIAMAIASVATDEERRSAMRTASLARAATFTWERCAAETVVAYRSALGR
jgi:glycosyltransferase involved in cell wall biosynthesis